MAGEQQFLLDASFKASEPETSAQMARAWIAAFSRTYEEIFQDRTTRSYDYVSQNAASTQEELERALARRTALLLEHPINLLTSDIEALQTRYQGDVTQLAVSRREFDSNEARVAALEDELAKQTSVVVLERSLDPDSLAVALQSGLSNRAFGELLGLRAQDESQNTTFVSLTSNAAYARARSVELANQIETLTVAVAGGRAKIDEKQREATETQAALDALNNEVQLLQNAYARLATKLQDARVALAETSGPIRVLDDPIVPTESISPRSTTSVAVAGFLGLLLGVTLAFVFDYLQRMRETPARARVTKTPGPDRDGPSAPAGKDS
jgi:succinoglycan biosynthesis transport protein ExoP